MSALGVAATTSFTAVPGSGRLDAAIFSLSPPEAEVAIRLIGGASAEDVAQRRGVSLDTVRNQMRAILRKSEATNLRDFERLMATFAKIGAATASPV